MSDHAKPVAAETQDPVEEIVPLMPVVLPVMGGVLTGYLRRPLLRVASLSSACFFAANRMCE